MAVGQTLPRDSARRPSRLRDWRTSGAQVAGVCTCARHEASRRAPLGRPPRESPAVAGLSRSGARGTRTPDLLGAIQALSQLSYSPARARERVRSPEFSWPAEAHGRPDRRCAVGSAKRLAVWSMVLLRMGLLDDAIRDHLELKRRRGADPAEVAREQREALDSGGGAGRGAFEPGGVARRRTPTCRRATISGDRRASAATAMRRRDS